MTSGVGGRGEAELCDENLREDDSHPIKHTQLINYTKKTPINGATKLEVVRSFEWCAENININFY